MIIKKVSNLLISSLLICAPFFSTISTVQAQDPQQLWALVICGSPEDTFRNDGSYMRHLFSPDHYGSIFAGVRYLDVAIDIRGADSLSTKSNVRDVIANWTRSQSTGNDIIFIYFTSHGGGYHAIDGLSNGRVETVGSDEGNEQRENTFVISFYPLNVPVDINDDGINDRLRDVDSDRFIEIDYNNDGSYTHQFGIPWDVDGDERKDDIFLDVDQDDQSDLAIDADSNLDTIVENFTSDYEDTNNDGRVIGIDLNQDGDQNDWVGIDESLQVKDGWYSDDELASDLGTLSYAKLVFIRQGCPKESRGCFGGGLIDDISASKRIIMTATNETFHSYGDMDNFGQPGYGYSEWSEAFIDALHRQRTHYDGAVIHDPVFVDADWSNDGHVSMWEAFQYAWYNDDARLSGLETPWIDDNGNDLPTYRGEQDTLDYRGGLESHDGLLAWETYLGFETLKSPDIDDNHKVDIEDLRTFAKAFGSCPGDPFWNPDADLCVDGVIDIADIYSAALMFGKEYSPSSSSSSSSAANSPVVSVYPGETTLRKYQTFSVNITVTNVTDLAAYQFELYYNRTILNCTGVALPSGHFLEPSVNPSLIFIVRLEYDNSFNSTHGFVWVAVTLLGEEPSKNGSGTLVTITFNTTAIGSSTLNLYNTKLVDTLAKPISIIVVHGSVNVLPSLTVLAEDQHSNHLTSGDVYINAQLVGYTGSTFQLQEGTYKVFVNDFWEANNTGYRYTFDHWEDDSVNNPRNITVIVDTTVTAYFNKKWCPGDVNGDGIVDIEDMYFVSTRYGAQRGEPKWDSQADLNCDLIIDIEDIYIVSNNFGNVYQ